MPFAKSVLILCGHTPCRYIADETGRVMHDITSKESYRRQFEAIQHCFRIIGFTDKVSDCQDKKKLKCSYSWVNENEDLKVPTWGSTHAFQMPCWSCYKVLLLRSVTQGPETLSSPKSLFGKGDGTPLQYSCLENPMDGGAWWAAVHGVARSWTRLKRLSNSSSSKSLLEMQILRSNQNS